MGSWMQEGVAEVSREYMIKDVVFDVNGWRALVNYFIDHVENMNLANRPSSDQEGLRTLYNIEARANQLERVAEFLRKIRPPEKYLYLGPCDSDDTEGILCKEMHDAIIEDILEEYEQTWLNQREQKNEKDNNSIDGKPYFDVDTGNRF